MGLISMLVEDAREGKNLNYTFNTSTKVLIGLLGRSAEMKLNYLVHLRVVSMVISPEYLFLFKLRMRDLFPSDLLQLH